VKYEDDNDDDDDDDLTSERESKAFFNYKIEKSYFSDYELCEMLCAV
jgi:hypothetical protein